MLWDIHVNSSVNHGAYLCSYIPKSVYSISVFQRSAFFWLLYSTCTTYRTYMQYIHAINTCNTYMQCRHAIQTCTAIHTYNTYIQYIHAIHTCNTYMHQVEIWRYIGHGSHNNYINQTNIYIWGVVTHAIVLIEFEFSIRLGRYWARV